MAVSFLTPARCILLVGDDALSVYDVSSRAARLVDTIAWQAEDFIETLSGLISRECKGKQVLILNDMTDQHFKGGQRIPNVSVIDKPNVLKRKLQVSFPNYPIRGALSMKQRKSLAPKGAPGGATSVANVKAGGGLYLFAAVPMSDSLANTFEAVKDSMSSVAGFCLLPVEASDMVKALAEKLAGKERKPSRWALFMGQHQNGALRQVITRDGELAMTRMTPVADASADPRTWAAEVYQEFKATISYLSRFGYSADESTEIMVVAGAEAGEALESMIDVPCHFTAFTSNEAARLLGMTIGAQENPRYADALHAAWCGRKVKFILPMDTPELSKFHKPRKTAAAASILLFLGASFLTFQTVSHGQTMIGMKMDMTEQKRLLADAETKYESEVKRMKDLGIDIKMIHGSLGSYELMEQQRVRVMPLLSLIGEALGNEMRIDKLIVNNITPPPEKPAPGAPTDLPPPKPQVEALMTLSFPPTLEPDVGVREVNNLERRLATLLPEYEITIPKQVADLSYTAAATGEAGQAKTEEQTQDMVAEIRIKGPVR